jgi:hypothetical protein
MFVDRSDTTCRYATPSEFIDNATSEEIGAELARLTAKKEALLARLGGGQLNGTTNVSPEERKAGDSSASRSNRNEGIKGCQFRTFFGPNKGSNILKTKS